jgi:uncharacterized coiled-coil protein SlyX
MLSRATIFCASFLLSNLGLLTNVHADSFLCPVGASRGDKLHTTGGPTNFYWIYHADWVDAGRPNCVPFYTQVVVDQQGASSAIADQLKKLTENLPAQFASKYKDQVALDLIRELEATLALQSNNITALQKRITALENAGRPR